MGKHTGVVLYVLALVTVVAGVDVLFFRHRLLERLMVNVGIVLVFAAFYLRLLKRAGAGCPDKHSQRQCPLGKVLADVAAPPRPVCNA
jgi:hypothetical protein